jgi:hypothetical protein
MFPIYLWSDVHFHEHRLQYWYVVNALNCVRDDENAAEDTEYNQEGYYEVYSDY